MKARKRIPLLAVGFIATVMLATGCHRSAPPSEETVTLPPANVRLATVTLSTNPAIAQVVGTVQARTSSVIAAKVSGRIAMIKTRIGEQVSTGDLLAEIDAAEIAARMEQAEASLENAIRDLERFTKLLAQSAVTQAEFDVVDTRYRVAQAAVNEARSMLAYTRIEAPFDGVIVRARADVGDLASPGMPLLELDSTSGLRFESDVSETLTSNIRLNDELTVMIEGHSQPLFLNVSEIAPAANPLSRTRTIRLNLEDVPGVRAGQFGRVEVPVAQASNVWVPSQSLIRRGQMEMVFVAEDAHAQMRLVKAGKERGGRVEILSGLSVGDRVVSEGADALRDGQALVIQP